LLPAGGRDWHIEEEQCLFFVALSRAKNTLRLSCAARYGKQTSNPSEFLSVIAPYLPRAVDVAPTLAVIAGTVPEPGIAPPSGNLKLSSREVDTYLRCPTQYFFDVVLGLGGRRTNPGYLQFHRCVYQVLSWMSSEQAAGKAAEHAATLVKLEEVWVASGPQEHAYAGFYRQEAERLLKGTIARVRGSAGKPLDIEWEVPLAHGVVTVRADHVTLIEGPRGKSLAIQRWRTGKPPKKPQNDEIYSLYAKGAELAYPDAQTSIETLYLSTNEAVVNSLTEKQVRAGIQKYDDALADILRGNFSPNPSDWICPRCPHYFICPSAAFRDQLRSVDKP
jgi:hypothetical protein